VTYTLHAYRNEIQAADPQSSGTGYTQLATYIQLWGEDEAFKYLKELNSAAWISLRYAGSARSFQHFGVGKLSFFKRSAYFKESYI